MKSARTEISPALEFFVNWNTKDAGRSPRSPIRPICETWSACSRPCGQPVGLPIHWREEQEIACRVDSPLWWANLAWPLESSPVSRVQITVLQSGGFVTVELWQRRSSWTWTSTTGGITAPSVRTWVRIDAFFAKICLSLKLQTRFGAAECAREILSMHTYCPVTESQGFNPLNPLSPTYIWFSLVETRLVAFTLVYFWFLQVVQLQTMGYKQRPHGS